MTPGQCRAARSWLNWSTREAAKRAAVSKTTLIRFEHGENVMYRSVDKIRRTYEKAGIEFNGRIGVIYRKDEEDAD